MGKEYDPRYIDLANEIIDNEDSWRLTRILAEKDAKIKELEGQELMAADIFDHKNKIIDELCKEIAAKDKEIAKLKSDLQQQRIFRNAHKERANQKDKEIARLKHMMRRRSLDGEEGD